MFLLFGIKTRQLVLCIWLLVSTTTSNFLMHFSSWVTFFSAPLVIFPSLLIMPVILFQMIMISSPEPWKTFLLPLNVVMIGSDCQSFESFALVDLFCCLHLVLCHYHWFVYWQNLLLQYQEVSLLSYIPIGFWHLHDGSRQIFSSCAIVMNFYQCYESAVVCHLVILLVGPLQEMAAMLFLLPIALAVIHFH